MTKISQYKTKQSEELLSYLRTTRGSHIAAADIVAHFASQGKKISVATVYRQLERLVDGGQLNKYFLAEGGGAHFEYINQEEDCAPLCFHCRCQQCGTLIHLQCQSLNQVQSHLQDGHGFTLDPIRTVFYGTCRSCAQTESESE